MKLTDIFDDTIRYNEFCHNETKGVFFEQLEFDRGG